MNFAIFNTWAVSSSLNPPKYRRSTILAWLGASFDSASTASSKATRDVYGKELSPVLPADVLHVYKAKVDLIDQGYGLERVAGSLWIYPAP